MRVVAAEADTAEMRSTLLEATVPVLGSRRARPKPTARRRVLQDDEVHDPRYDGETFSQRDVLVIYDATDLTSPIPR